MKAIHHIAIYTNHFDELAKFYKEYFYAVQDGAEYYNPDTHLKTCFLKFDGPVRLELMTKPDLAEQKSGPAKTGITHFAFSVGSNAEVDSLAADLFKAGCRVISPPRVTGDGYYESCVADPDGNEIEITK
ncbi:MAG: VOC family protein [Oscillospiraceae bacterium]|jgi:lactoylglutathione lyase|nr:VOC family protein [Oscillospiraceae bacterium]MCI1990419.1 VOC family protein [Oscillospiraceae bacterium]MCI2035186.1 VOC family protein [Oscillospiraceae bacterium]